jgi:hypothetical protein
VTAGARCTPGRRSGEHPHGSTCPTHPRPIRLSPTRDRREGTWLCAAAPSGVSLI